MEIKIRKANKNDVEGIINLQHEWKREGISWAVFPITRKEILKDIEKNIFFVIEYKKEIIGFIEGEIKKSKNTSTIMNLKKGRNYGDLHDLYIKKKFRNKGIGELLVKKLLNYFDKKEIKVVKLRAVNKNLWRLADFYKKFDFEERILEMMRLKK